MPKKSSSPAPSTYRFDDATRALMDRLADRLAETSGLPCSRTDVIRFAVRQLAEKILPKKSKKSEEGT